MDRGARRTAAGRCISSRQFSSELEAIRERRYALDDEEWFDGMVGASVPTTNGKEAPCTFLSTHSLITRKTVVDVEDKVPAMQAAAKELKRLFFPA